jgi:two-component system, NtrC family, sensor kinase
VTGSAEGDARAGAGATPGLAALRDVAAGLAHELRNPLQFIQNYAAVVAELGSELDGILEDVRPTLASSAVDDLTSLHVELAMASEQIVRHANRLDAIVESMLATSGESAAQRELADLNVLVRESVEYAYEGRRGPSAILVEHIDVDLDPSIPLVMVDALRLSRAVVNLVTNALQAADDGAERRQPTVVVRTRRIGDEFAVVVEDNGPGIPEEVRAKVFEPFFSTKGGRAHAGLGLTQVWDIVVVDHGGTVEIDRTPAGHTVFTITIP